MSSLSPPTYSFVDTSLSLDFSRLSVGRTGIEHLPAEILGHILSLASEPNSAPGAGLLALRTSQATVFSCALVCQRWRTVALQQGVLWSRVIDFERNSVARLHELLELSHPCLFNVGHSFAPVLISSSDQSRDLSDLFALLLAYQNRIVEWHVKWDYDHSHVPKPAYFSEFDLQAPHLEAITWEGGGPFDGRVEHLATGTPPRFSLPNLPLKRLNLGSSYFVLTPPSQCLNTLTQLSFSYQGHLEPRAYCPTIVDWRDILRATPRLQLLSIRSGMEDTLPLPPQALLPTEPILLPDLALISLGASRPTDSHLLARLLQSLRPSHMCGLQLSLVLLGEALVNYLQQRIASIVAQFPHAHPAMELVVDDQSRITFGNVRDPEHLLDWSSRGAENVLDLLYSMDMPVVTFQSVASTEIGMDAFDEVIRCLQPLLSRATSFRMSVDPASVIATMPRMSILSPRQGLLLYMPQLTTLMLDQEAAGIVFQFLDKLVVVEPGTNVWVPFLPRLNQLTLDSCQLVTGSPLLQTLTTYLAWRSERNFGIPNVVVSRSYVPEETLDVFKVMEEQSGHEILVDIVHLDVPLYAQFCRRT